MAPTKKKTEKKKKKGSSTAKSTAAKEKGEAAKGTRGTNNNPVVPAAPRRSPRPPPERPRRRRRPRSQMSPAATEGSGLASVSSASASCEIRATCPLPPDVTHISEAETAGGGSGPGGGPSSSSADGGGGGGGSVESCRIRWASQEECGPDCPGPLSSSSSFASSVGRRKGRGKNKGGGCRNSRIRRHEDKTSILEVYDTGTPKGLAVRTLGPIKAKEYVAEYAGVRVPASRLDALRRKYDQEHKERGESGAPPLYLMRLDEKWILDARHRGNVARYINHGCDPNCRIDVWKVDNVPRACIFAKRDIEPGEDLTYDYGWDMEDEGGMEPTRCLCGAEGCRGTLERPSPRSRSPSPASPSPRTTSRAGDTEADDSGASPRSIHRIKRVHRRPAALADYEVRKKKRRYHKKNKGGGAGEIDDEDDTFSSTSVETATVARMTGAEKDVATGGMSAREVEYRRRVNAFRVADEDAGLLEAMFRRGANKRSKKSQAARKNDNGAEKNGGGSSDINREKEKNIDTSGNKKNGDSGKHEGSTEGGNKDDHRKRKKRGDNGGTDNKDVDRDRSTKEGGDGDNTGRDGVDETRQEAGKEPPAVEEVLHPPVPPAGVSEADGTPPLALESLTERFPDRQRNQKRRRYPRSSHRSSSLSSSSLFSSSASSRSPSRDAKVRRGSSSPGVAPTPNPGFGRLLRSRSGVGAFLEAAGATPAAAILSNSNNNGESRECDENGDASEDRYENREEREYYRRTRSYQEANSIGDNALMHARMISAARYRQKKKGRCKGASGESEQRSTEASCAREKESPEPTSPAPDSSAGAAPDGGSTAVCSLPSRGSLSLTPRHANSGGAIAGDDGRMGESAIINDQGERSIAAGGNIAVEDGSKANEESSPPAEATKKTAPTPTPAGKQGGRCGAKIIEGTFVRAEGDAFFLQSRSGEGSLGGRALSANSESAKSRRSNEAGGQSGMLVRTNGGGSFPKRHRGEHSGQPLPENSDNAKRKRSDEVDGQSAFLTGVVASRGRQSSFKLGNSFAKTIEDRDSGPLFAGPGGETADNDSNGSRLPSLSSVSSTVMPRLGAAEAASGKAAPSDVGGNGADSVPCAEREEEEGQQLTREVEPDFMHADISLRLREKHGHIRAELEKINQAMHSMRHTISICCSQANGRGIGFLEKTKQSMRCDLQWNSLMQQRLKAELLWIEEHIRRKECLAADQKGSDGKTVAELSKKSILTKVMQSPNASGATSNKAAPSGIGGAPCAEGGEENEVGGQLLSEVESDVAYGNICCRLHKERDQIRAELDEIDRVIGPMEKAVSSRGGADGNREERGESLSTFLFSKKTMQFMQCDLLWNNLERECLKAKITWIEEHIHWAKCNAAGQQSCANGGLRYCPAGKT